MKQYIAGFLDADGTIGMNSKGVVSVEFYNADKTILEKIQKHYGGRLVTRLSKKKEHNTSYTLRFSYNGAYNLIVDIQPYMLHKKKSQRAELIVKHYKAYTPRNGKYSPELREQKDWLIGQIRDITMRGAGAY